MTIYQLKKLNEKNGGCFFKTPNMKRHGDVLKGYRIEKISENCVKVSRKYPIRNTTNSWIFNALTGRLIPQFSCNQVK